MNEQEIRALVREAIARHTAGSVNVSAGGGSGRGLPEASFAIVRQHASHGLLPVPAGAEADGLCVIEPTVQCNHCGYCKSYGH